MKIKEAEMVKLYAGGDWRSMRAKQLLEEAKIFFQQIEWQGFFPVDCLIRGGSYKLVQNCIFSEPPLIEVYFRPGKFLILQGLEEISHGIDEDW